MPDREGYFIVVDTGPGRRVFYAWQNRQPWWLTHTWDDKHGRWTMSEYHASSAKPEMFSSVEQVNDEVRKVYGRFTPEFLDRMWLMDALTGHRVSVNGWPWRARDAIVKNVL